MARGANGLKLGPILLDDNIRAKSNRRIASVAFVAY